MRLNDLIREVLALLLTTLVVAALGFGVGFMLAALAHSDDFSQLIYRH